MLERVQGVLAVTACAAAVVCCSGAADDAPRLGIEAASAPPRRPDPAELSAADAAPPELRFDAVAPDASREPMAFCVDDENRLVSFRLAAPGVVEATAITGLVKDERVVGIDIRPADGKLYALGTTSRLYVIDRTTAAASVVSTTPFTPALAGQAWGFDFNPVVDRIRIVTEFDQNLRLDPANGTAVGNDAALAFAPGDPNAGQSPAIVAAAYTNSVSPAPASTTLYGIDATRDLLVALSNPNDGKVTTIGSLGINVADDALGFDIRGTDATKLEAFAAIRVGEDNELHTIDLATGEATLVAKVGHASALHGMAIDP